MTQRKRDGREEGARYDLVIAGGRVLDPGTGTDAVLDVAVNGDRIVRVEAGIDRAKAARVIDAAGRVVTPGLIDLHAHVGGGMRKIVREDLMVQADTAGVHGGCTTVVDGGSAGAYNIGGLVNAVVSRARTRVLAFVNVGTLGVTRAPEVRGPEDMDHAATVEAVRANRDVILGVKLRLVSPDILAQGMDLVLAAKAMAAEAEAPLMVHVGDIGGDHPVAAEITPRLLSEVLTAGDIVTHTLSFHVGALLADGKVIPEAREARDKGVIFDVGVGKNNFSFDSARRILEQGFMPDTISTDLTAMSLHAGPTHSMMECLGKMLSLGLSLEEAVPMVTLRSAEVLGLAHEIGTLAAGKAADISVLEVVEGAWLFRDVTGGTHRGSLALRPVACVRAGEVMPIDYGPRPWGWLPESA